MVFYKTFYFVKKQGFLSKVQTLNSGYNRLKIYFCKGNDCQLIQSKGASGDFFDIYSIQVGKVVFKLRYFKGFASRAFP